MGVDIGSKCRNCGFEDNFILGVGISHFYMNMTIDTLIKFAESKREERIILNFRDNHQGTFHDSRFYTYYECTKCETLYSFFHYEISYDSGKIYTKEYRCEKCNNLLKLYQLGEEPDFSNYRCKKCGQKTLMNMGIVVHWD